MTTLASAHTDQLFIDGAWTRPSTDATFELTDSTSEEVFATVAAASETDVAAAVTAARTAFDSGPWPRMTPQERGAYLHKFADGLRARSEQVAQSWPRESGVLYRIAGFVTPGAAATFDYYGDLGDTYPFVTPMPAQTAKFGALVREPVGVVGAIVPWNGPLQLITSKVAPALLAGCTVVLKSAPEAPLTGYLFADVADEIGLPPGVFNVVTAGREVSESLVTDPRVDKIAFTGSTAAGRRIASLCGSRIARYTLELGGKSAAIVLDDYDIEAVAQTLTNAECELTGQVCASLTRIIVSERRHDELVEALSVGFAAKRVGDPFDPQTDMGPLASREQRARVEGLIKQGVEEGAQLATGGGRPKDLDRGWFVEPTVFGNVDNGSTIAQNEIFGPVLSVIPAKDEEDAIAIANDSIYGLNASVFTNDADRAYSIARRLRSGTVGQNSTHGDFSIAFGGFKQSGIGREGGIEGLLPYLETKTVLLADTPTALRSA